MIDALLVYLVKPEGQEAGAIAAVRMGWTVYDIGKRIGTFLASKAGRTNMALEVQDFFETDFLQVMSGQPQGIIAFANPGILFEPELDMNPRQLMAWAARRCRIALIWPGTEERGTLKLGGDGSQYRIDLSHIDFRIVQEET